ncbi:hypothetical protein [Haloarcula nitratireducens]|uniref:Uncharacterized protein n=1 Tax=Haloarcula nitratireducens TaxID=2487749 RepID=A0AAW4P790_9EURY|nr:hypothetical protein [Halomicroarcula nitratireducens]MBX0293674.1 hypothetical protein [Halomicroarcula nitratireducens]
MSTDTPSGTRGVVTVERIAVWGVALLAVAGVVAVIAGPGADLRMAAPGVTVDGSYDADAGAVTVTLAGDDRLTSTSTNELAVVVTDASRNETTRLVWADGGELPVGAGDSFTVDDPSVDSDGNGNYLDGDGSVGFYLESGDAVDVVWTGRLVGAPDERTDTLGTVTIGNGSA